MLLIELIRQFVATARRFARKLAPTPMLNAGTPACANEK